MAAEHGFQISVQQPYDWPSLLEFLRLRATPGVEQVADGHYTRTFSNGNGQEIIAISYDAQSSSLQVRHSGKADLENYLRARVQQLFRTDVCTQPIESALMQDARLRVAVSKQPGLRVPGAWDAFEVAVRAVLGQQITVAGATTLMGRFVRAAGTSPKDERVLFPSPEAVLRADLRTIGAPAKRLHTLHSIAKLFAESGPACLEQNGALDRLVSIAGIGRWTAGYILMRAGPDHDHWPEGDLVLRKALTSGPELVSTREMTQLFSRWSPYRSYAAVHLWRSYGNNGNRQD